MQTGQVPFFNQIAQDSIAFVELLADKLTIKDEVIFIAINDDIYYAYNDTATRLQEQSNAKFRCIDLSSFYKQSLINLSIELHKQLYFEIAEPIDTLTIVNGACVEDFNQEVSYFAHWLSAETSDALESCTLNKYETGVFMCFQLIALIAAKQNSILQINNVNEDPMQCKLRPLLHFIDTKVHQRDLLYKHVPVIKQFFFHEHDGYEFCPFQQYPYLHGKKFDYVDATYSEFNQHDFVFSMTNVWADKHDRTEIIDALQYMHTPAYQPATKFIFQYACKHIARQDLIDSSDELLSYSRYLNLLWHSKYTLIIPSYDTTTFSLRRFVEALMQECVPLVYDKCNLDWMPTELHDILEHSNLIVHDLSKLKEHVNAIKLNWHNQLNALTHNVWLYNYAASDIYLDCLQKCKLL